MQKFKDYSTVESAKRALRKAELQALPVEFEVIKNKFDQERFMPVVKCHTMTEVETCKAHGFKAVVEMESMAS